MIYKMGKNKKILKLVTSAQRKFGIAGFIFIYVSDHLELTWKKKLENFVSDKFRNVRRHHRKSEQQNFIWFLFYQFQMIWNV